MDTAMEIQSNTIKSKEESSNTPETETQISSENNVLLNTRLTEDDAKNSENKPLVQPVTDVVDPGSSAEITEDVQVSEVSTTAEVSVHSSDVVDSRSPIVPNFRIGPGDENNSVPLPINSGNRVFNGTAVTSELDGEDLENAIPGSVVNSRVPVHASGDVESMGTASLSRENSEELQLSLVSWYSEPGHHSFNPASCCSRTEAETRPFSNELIEEGDKSDEKENTTPTRDMPQSLKLSPDSGLSPRSVIKNNGSVRKAGALTVGGEQRNVQNASHHHTVNSLECAKCVRRSKSGNSTPASQTRTPKRRIASNKFSNELKKPIKSILKCESRASSSSDKQSSADSLGSASGVRANMLKSDVLPRSKLNFNDEHKPLDLEANLRSVEKYATLRLRKPRAPPPNLAKVFGERNTSPGSTGPGRPGIPNELMTKSLSFLDKSKNSSFPAGSKTEIPATSPLQRQGSLRLRKPSPGWEPNATRSSILRVQKIQEAKAKTSSFPNQHPFGSGSHSGSGDSIQHHSLSYSTPVRPVSHEIRSVPSKVFAKLASPFGQTVSSAQKTVRQHKKVQTDEEAAKFLERLEILEAENKSYKEKYLRLRGKCSMLERENQGLTGCVEGLKHQMNSMQADHADTVKFLEDEKALLLETVSESEDSLRSHQKENQEHEVRTRISGLVRQNEQLRQEAKTAKAVFNKWEKDMCAKIHDTDEFIQSIMLLIEYTLGRIGRVNEYLYKMYDITEEMVVTTTKVAKSQTVFPEKFPDGGILEPLLLALTKEFIKINSVDLSIAKVIPLEKCFGVRSRSSYSNGFDKSRNGLGTQLDEAVGSASIPQSSAVHTSNNGHDVTLDSLKTAIQERDEAERQERESPVTKSEEYHPLVVMIHDMLQSLSKTAVLIRIIVERNDSQIKEMAEGLIRNMLNCGGEAACEENNVATADSQRGNSCPCFKSPENLFHSKKDLVSLVELFAAYGRRYHHFLQKLK